MALRRYIPSAVRVRVLTPLRRHVGGFFYDTGRRILGHNDALVPPTKMIYTGAGDFRAIGYKFLHYFIAYGGLTPRDRVLEIGSGLGRMALPLLDYLREGSYDGIDIVPHGVEWCRANISRRNERFRFHVADIHNLEYNRGGRVSAAEYTFPFDDRSFDFVILTSVFTHLLPDATERYVAEIARMLAPGGRCLSTWFLLDERSRAAMAAGNASFRFAHPVAGYDTVLCKHKDSPEAAIAYDEAYVVNVLKRNGLQLRGDIVHGAWSKAEHATTMQDLVVSTLRPADVDR